MLRGVRVPDLLADAQRHLEGLAGLDLVGRVDDGDMLLLLPVRLLQPFAQARHVNPPSSLFVDSHATPQGHASCGLETLGPTRSTCSAHR